MVFWVPVIAVADIALDLLTGKDLVEYASGVDIIGSVMNYGSDLLGLDHEDWTEGNGLLDVDIPTIPELITGNNDSSVLNIDGDGTKWSDQSISLDSLEDAMNQFYDWLGQVNDNIIDGLNYISGQIDFWGWTILAAVSFCILVGIVTMLGTWKNGKRLKFLGRSKK